MTEGSVRMKVISVAWILHQLSSLYVNITGPSQLPSQALWLWDTDVITSSFKFPAFRRCSAAVIELDWGNWPNTCRFHCNVKVLLVISWFIVSLSIMLAQNCRPHILIPDVTCCFMMLQTCKPAARKRWTATHFTKTEEFHSSVSSWGCEVLSFTTSVTSGNVSSHARNSKTSVNEIHLP